jgi:hypothetical protein
LRCSKGQSGKDYEQAGDLTLFGLNATHWRTRTGARGVTGYFYAAERQRIVTASLARSSERDALFDPAQAYASDLLWHAAPLHQLIRSKVRLAGSGMSPDGHLLLGAGAHASIEPWLPVRETCLAWAVTFTDRGALQGALQARFDERLANPYAGPVIVLLAPGLHAKITFDAIAQEHIWGLADATGRWIGLTLHHDEAQAMIAARLQRSRSWGMCILSWPKPDLPPPCLRCSPWRWWRACQTWARLTF